MWEYIKPTPSVLVSKVMIFKSTHQTCEVWVLVSLLKQKRKQAIGTTSHYVKSVLGVCPLGLTVLICKERKSNVNEHNYKSIIVITKSCARVLLMPTSSCPQKHHILATQRVDEGKK